MDQQEILLVLNEIGAVITDSHIVYTSGKHGSAYVNKDAIYPYAGLTSILCQELAKEFKDLYPEVVIAPAIGGINLESKVAEHLNKFPHAHEVLGVYAEKLQRRIFKASSATSVRIDWIDREDSRDTEVVLSKNEEVAVITNQFTINRGYDKLVRGKRVLVVEDILNTGGSAAGVVEAVRAVNGEVIGVGALCNRGNVTAKDLGDVPKLVSLVNIQMDIWDEEVCPLCKKGVPINTDVGKGKQFLEQNGK